MTTTNRATVSPTATVSELLASLARRLDPLIVTRLKTSLHGMAWTDLLTELDRSRGRPPRTYKRTDLQSQLRMLTERLGKLGYPFDDDLRQVSTVASELRIIRNRWAHNDELTDLDAIRTADFAARLLHSLEDPDGAHTIEKWRTQLLTSYAATHGADSLKSAPPVEPATDRPLTRKVGPAEPRRKTPVATHTANYTAPAAEDLERADSSGVTSADTPTIGTGRYEFEAWEVVPVGEPDVIDNLPKKDAKMQVRGVAAEIAEFEGPVSIDRLVTLTTRSFGMSRCGTKKKQQIARQLRQLELAVDADGFIWPSDMAPETWHEFRPNDSEADRRFEDISPIEVANAWRIIAARKPGALDDEIRRAVLQAFGRKRMTSGITAHLDRAQHHL